MQLLTSNKKLSLAVPGHDILGLQLAPHDVAISGKSVCPGSTPGCRASCIFSSGFGKFKSVEQARINRTKLFFSNRERFLNKLDAEISEAKYRAQLKGKKLAIRLNVFSDIPFYRLSRLMQKHIDVTFYDYTKNRRTIVDYLNGETPSNYRLTWSLAETLDNYQMAIHCLNNGVNVAVPFADELPNEFLGHKVNDGDANDARFLEGFIGIIGLRVKGDGKKDKTGFIIREKVAALA